jgi:hypothetical protein
MSKLKKENKNTLPVTKKEKPIKKIKSMPQTYVEDTFDITNNVNTTQIIIENKVNVKTKKIITKDELLQMNQFKMKVDRLVKNIMFEKSFNELLDFVNIGKRYKTYIIDEYTDEIDVMLEVIILTFKKRLPKIIMHYNDYQKISAYFDSLASLYSRFKNSEQLIKDDLKQEREKLLSAELYMRVNFFNHL